MSKRARPVLTLELAASTVKVTVAGDFNSDVLYRAIEHLELQAKDLYREEKSHD